MDDNVTVGLPEILKRCQDLRIAEERCLTDEYVELVVYSDELHAWYTIFADIMGPPISPGGMPPSANDLAVTKDYGSVWTNQTLFKRLTANGIMIAMFWPWQDGDHITLKMASLGKESVQ